MLALSLLPLRQVASVPMAGDVIREFLRPVVQTLAIIAGLVSTLCIVIGGVLYSTSSGNPEKLEHGKRIIRNALIGLVLVIAATALTSLLTHAYHSPAATNFSTIPSLGTLQPQSTGFSIVQILIKAVTGFLNNIIQSIAAPFLKALGSFTSATPLMATNNAVFNLWLITVGIADAIFVLVVSLLGFHLMSASVLDLDELSLKHLLPQLAAVFVLINCSIFMIDGLISFSNVLIHAVQVGLGDLSVWNALTDVVKQAGGFGVAALLIMLAFLVLSVVLLIYYVLRIVTLYIGAVVAPFVILLWLIPSFKDFAHTAFKTYVANVFVLFVHVIILGLAASLFAGMSSGPTHVPDPLMAMIVGIATLLALLKTQGFMTQLSYASVGARSMRKLGSQFVNGASFIAGVRPRAASQTNSTSRQTTNINTVSTKKQTVYKGSYSAVNRQPNQPPKPLVVQMLKGSSDPTGTTKPAPLTNPSPIKENA